MGEGKGRVGIHETSAVPEHTSIRSCSFSAFDFASFSLCEMETLHRTHGTVQTRP